jgi:cysteine synthase A
MIESLEMQGKLHANSVIIEPTSGNTGIALAFVAASRGYRIILCMPETMSIERRKLLRYLGAELELTPASGGMKRAIARAEELAEVIPNAIIPQQFQNPANPLAHEKSTALEIIADTGGQFDAFVAGVGTGGTLTGCATVFKQKNINAKIFAVEPTDSPVLSGGTPAPHKIQGIGAGFIPDVLNQDLIDEIILIENQTAFDTARLVARLDGIPVGISSGASLGAAIKIAQRPDMAGKRIVVIIASVAERYISTALFDGLE